MAELCVLEIEDLPSNKDGGADTVDFVNPEAVLTALLMEALNMIFISAYKVILYGSFGRWIKKKWTKYKTKKKMRLNLREFMESGKNRDIDFLCENPSDAADDVFKALKKTTPEVVMKPKDGGGKSLFYRNFKIIDFSKISAIVKQTEDIASFDGGTVTVLSDAAIVSTVRGYFETFGSSGKSKFMFKLQDFISKLEEKFVDAETFFPKGVPKTSELAFLDNDEQDWERQEYLKKYEQSYTCEQTFPLFLVSDLAKEYLSNTFLEVVTRNTPFREVPSNNNALRDAKEFVFISEGVSRKNAIYDIIGISDTSKYYKINDTTYGHLRPPSKMKTWVVNGQLFISPLYQICRIVDKINFHVHNDIDHSELNYMYCVYMKFLKNVLAAGDLWVLITSSEHDTTIVNGDIVT